MSTRSRPGRVYKEITLLQLRSFCETVRLGSLTAAADLLGLARPTVWKQVHALEHFLGMKLIEPHTRGCRPTDAGRFLAEKASPLVTGIGSLKQLLQSHRATRAIPLTLAASSRCLIEDLPACVTECERRYPHIRLLLNEMKGDLVEAAVASRRVDVGLAGLDADPENPWLLYEPCYQLDIVLVTRRDHPLAHSQCVRASDLAAFPMVNAPTSFSHKELNRTLERLGVFKTQPRRVEAESSSAIRRYVAMGMGIGLIAVSPLHRPDPELHERPMTRDLGRTTVHAIRRKGDVQSEVSGKFVTIVKSILDHPQLDAAR